MNISVSLTDDLAQYVNSKVDSGRYNSLNEVILEALRLMETLDRNPEDVQHLRAAWDDGIKSADYQPLDLNVIKAEGLRRLAGQD
jgi:antitoxin ParD1/3/4